MAQTQFKVIGVTNQNADEIRDAGMSVSGVKWVNVNDDNIVVTHEDDFDDSVFFAAVESVSDGVSLSK